MILHGLRFLVLLLCYALCVLVVLAMLCCDKCFAELCCACCHHIAQGDQPRAYFYLDPYSRPADKNGGAWMGEVRVLVGGGSVKGDAGLGESGVTSQHVIITTVVVLATLCNVEQTRIMCVLLVAAGASIAEA